MATEQRTGSTALQLHQSENSFYLFSYCTLVDGALAFRIVFLMVAVQTLTSVSGPAAAKPRAGGYRGLDAESDPQQLKEVLPVGEAPWRAAAEPAQQWKLVSLAKREPPEVACGPAEAPSGMWKESGAVVGRHTVL